MEFVIKYFVRKSFVVNLLTFFVFAFGFISFCHSKRDLIPQMNMKYVSITTTLVGSSAVDIEKNITFPIEEALKNISGVKEISSTSVDSSSRINIIFRDDYDEMSEATENIKSIVDSLKSELPDEIEPINVQQLKVDNVYAMGFAITGVDKLSSIDRGWITKFEEMLRRVEGVVYASSDLEKREVFIEFDKNKIARHNVSVSAIRNKVASVISYMPIARFHNKQEKVSIELKNRINSVEDIKNIPIISSRSGDTLYLKDFSNVSFRFPKSSYADYFRGEDYVSVDVKKDMDSDIIIVAEQLREVADDFAKLAPKHFKIESQNDTSIFIKKQLKVLRNNALLGVVLVCLTLFFFLGGRVSFMTVLGLPFSYFGTFIVLGMFNVSIDLISIVGLILVIGILVDDAIVVSEQYVQFLDKGLNSFDAAYSAVRATIIPVTGTVLTTAVAFASILMVSGGAADIFFAIPCVVISALFLSWIESFFILPNHLHHFIKTSSKRSESKAFLKIKSTYINLLGKCLRFRYLFLASVIGLLIATGFIAISKLEKDFSLSIGKEHISIDAALVKSGSLEETKKALIPIENFIKTLPADQVDSFRTQIGHVWRNHRELEGDRFARIRITLSDKLKSPRDVKEELSKLIREELKTLKTDKFEYLYERSVMAGDEKNVKDIVTIYISGRDQMPYDELQSQIKKEVESIDGVVEIFLDEDKYQKKWQFFPNYADLLKYQVSEYELINQLRGHFSPQELTQFRLNGENTYIYTEFSDFEKTNFNNLNRISIETPIGESVPVRFLGVWKETESLKEISHEDLLRKIEIDIKYNKDKVKKDVVADQIEDSLKELKAKYPVLTFSVVKESKEEKENKEWMKKIAYISIGLILLILMLCLQSIVQPLLVGSIIPFGIIGVIWALYFHSIPLGLMAVIGIVGMAGVVVNDSLIMVDAINKIKLQGESVKAKIIQGASSRLRPIIITTITTLGGVFPMAYGLGGDVGFTSPLAFSMGWGLLFATILTLFFLPCLMLILEDIKSLFIRLFYKFRPAK